MEVKPGQMVYKLVLEEGVFRFDCSADARNSSFPSFSFVNPKERDTPLVNIHKSPSYIPTFEFVAEQHVVYFEVSRTSFYGTGEVSGQLERTGKRVGFYFFFSSIIYLFFIN
ncbi:hypothetical protein HanLR1_Chr00c0648g0765711 [Helianthus annuus]|nr:hypothetical protein HanLR1_Chr00c0648g0765711 [Helianthus annuus]